MLCGLFSCTVVIHTSPQVGRVFSDILMCQAESTGSVANVKDMYLAGGSVNPLFDSSVVSNITSFNVLHYQPTVCTNCRCTTFLIVISHKWLCTMCFTAFHVLVEWNRIYQWKNCQWSDILQVSSCINNYKICT